MSEVTYAKHYYIADAKVPDLDKCWSACNGIEGLGHFDKDPEMRKARRRHGECIESLPRAPRLILYRKTKGSPLKAKLWTVRTITHRDGVILFLASLAKACHTYGSIFDAKSGLDVYLIDWGPTSRYDDAERYEISIELVDGYKDFSELKADYRKFMKHFDKGAWK